MIRRYPSVTGVSGEGEGPESAPSVAIKKTKRGVPGNKFALKHGMTNLKRRVRVKGLSCIDRRTSTARALFAWRDQVIGDLGGKETVTAAQGALVEAAARTKLYLDSIDAWIMQQGSLVNSRKRSVLPVVRERTLIADSLARYLSMLGLERRARAIPTLAAYVASRQAAQEAQTSEPPTPTITPAPITLQADDGGDGA